MHSGQVHVTPTTFYQSFTHKKKKKKKPFGTNSRQRFSAGKQQTRSFWCENYENTTHDSHNIHDHIKKPHKPSCQLENFKSFYRAMNKWNTSPRGEKKMQTEFYTTSIVIFAMFIALLDFLPLVIALFHQERNKSSATITPVSFPLTRADNLLSLSFPEETDKMRCHLLLGKATFKCIKFAPK